METYFFDNNTNMTIMSDWIKPVTYMLDEHYKFIDTWININSIAYYGHDRSKAIYYDLEHKFPTNISLETDEFTEMFINLVKEFDYILCFQIENYEYYKKYGLQHKFRFVPLRYTSYFSSFNIPVYENRIFDLQFECSVDTKIRKNFIEKITSKINTNNLDCSSNNKLSVLMSNIDNSEKYKFKCLAKYGIDFPHYDIPTTLNCYRIWEYACLNIPVILIDNYNVGTQKYFENIIVDKFDMNFELYKIKNICNTYCTYTDIFKKQTFNDYNYENYKISIVKDFSDKYHVHIPDTVLLTDFNR